MQVLEHSEQGQTTLQAQTSPAQPLVDRALQSMPDDTDANAGQAAPVTDAAASLQAPAGRVARPSRLSILRLVATDTGITLAFDIAVFAAMAVMGWNLAMPWDQALTAGENMMAIGLLVCTGLWASISADDLHRWQKLHRRWKAQALRASAPQLAAAQAEGEAGVRSEARPVRTMAPRGTDEADVPSLLRVRSVVKPSRQRPDVMSRSPWRVSRS